MADDMLDLSQGTSKKDDPATTPAGEKVDPLAFLGDFKKRVTGEMPAIAMTAPKVIEEESRSGITPLDIAGLPEDQKRVMFSILRDKDAAKDGLTVEQLQNKLGTTEDLSDTLAQLAQDEWLLTSGTPPAARYKLNLRRKKGRLSSNIWAALDK
jgi:hypothetical protein